MLGKLFLSRECHTSAPTQEMNGPLFLGRNLLSAANSSQHAAISSFSFYRPGVVSCSLWISPLMSKRAAISISWDVLGRYSISTVYSIQFDVHELC